VVVVEVEEEGLLRRRFLDGGADMVPSLSEKWESLDDDLGNLKGAIPV
jgi:hypothetical protein